MTAVVAGFLVPEGHHRSIRLRGQRPGDLTYPVHRLFRARGGRNIGCGDICPYKPLARGDWKGVNIVASASRAFYQKSGAVFLALLVGLSVIYPVFVSAGALLPGEIGR